MKENKQKILVIDDEKELSTVIKDILEEAGYDILLAENGAEGLKLATANQPDLILCDIQMPAMNGYELLNEMKAHTELAKIPFVFMTGVNTGRFEVRRGMDLGADDYLNKPFTVEDLVNAVGSRLKKKQSWQKFIDTRIERIHTDIVLLLPNELHMLVMDILEQSQLLLSEKAVSTDTVHKTAKQIQASGKRLSHLHENILLFALLQLWANDPEMIESLRSETTESYLDVLTSVVNENSRASDRKGSIKTHCDNAAVQISPAYFGKIIDEVIDNACKYSDPHSTVSINSFNNEKDIVLSISDAGKGMSLKELDDVVSLSKDNLQNFSRQGSVMGLTISKTLAEIHGGELTIESEKNKGTTVTIRLPKVKTV